MKKQKEIIETLGDHKDLLMKLLEQEIRLQKSHAYRYSSEDSYNKIHETKIVLYLIEELFDSE